MVNNTTEICEDSLAKMNEEIFSNRRSHESKIEELEGILRKLRVECENINLKKEYLVDTTNRRVSAAITETLSKYDK